jgi:hypothetical protein
MFTRTGAETSQVTSNRRLHRIAAFTAASVLFGVISTVSALATQHEATSPPAHAAVAVVTNLSATEDAVLSGSDARRYADADEVRTVTPKVSKATHARPAGVTIVKKTARQRTVTTRHTTTVKAVTTSVSPARVAVTHVASSGVRVISHYTDAPGSQQAIDSCKLVLWSHAPLWLAGHNWCGWQWMAYVPNGTTVKVSGGAAAGTYVVTGHLHLGRQGGAMPRVNADLVLQTCIGSGTGLTLLNRV